MQGLSKNECNEGDCFIIPNFNKSYNLEALKKYPISQCLNFCNKYISYDGKCYLFLYTKAIMTTHEVREAFGQTPTTKIQNYIVTTSERASFPNTTFYLSFIPEILKLHNNLNEFLAVFNISNVTTVIPGILYSFNIGKKKLKKMSYIIPFLRAMTFESASGQNSLAVYNGSLIPIAQIYNVNSPENFLNIPHVKNFLEANVIETYSEDDNIFCLARDMETVHNIIRLFNFSTAGSRVYRCKLYALKEDEETRFKYNRVTIPRKKFSEKNEKEIYSTFSNNNHIRLYNIEFSENEITVITEDAKSIQYFLKKYPEASTASYSLMIIYFLPKKITPDNLSASFKQVCPFYYYEENSEEFRTTPSFYLYIDRRNEAKLKSNINTLDRSTIPFVINAREFTNFLEIVNGITNYKIQIPNADLDDVYSKAVRQEVSISLIYENDNEVTIGFPSQNDLDVFKKVLQPSKTQQLHKTHLHFIPPTKSEDQQYVKDLKLLRYNSIIKDLLQFQKIQEHTVATPSSNTVTSASRKPNSKIINEIIKVNSDNFLPRGESTSNKQEPKPNTNLKENPSDSESLITTDSETFSSSTDSTSFSDIYI